ncbi:MAG: hypothetical protein RLZZ628_2164 [Bacteroidota bacterium]|jgi:hypothetical protein
MVQISCLKNIIWAYDLGELGLKNFPTHEIFMPTLKQKQRFIFPQISRINAQIFAKKICEKLRIYPRKLREKDRNYPFFQF